MKKIETPSDQTQYIRCLQLEISDLKQELSEYKKRDIQKTDSCRKNVEQMFSDTLYESIVTKNLNDRELETLSNGLLALLEQAGQAKKLIHDKTILDGIEMYCTEIQMLNAKICASSISEDGPEEDLFAKNSN